MLSKGVVTLKPRAGKCYNACNIHCDVFFKEIKPYRTRLFYMVSTKFSEIRITDQLKSKVPSPVQIFIFRAMGGGGTPDQLKSQVPSRVQIFNFLGEGGTLDQLKSKVPQSRKIFICACGWGRQVLQTNSNPRCQVLTKFSLLLAR